MKRWVISSNESGIKLTDFLKQKIGMECSSRHLKRLIENKCCQVNGKTERFASAVLGAGDVVVFKWEEPRTNFKDLLADPIRILYEDADLFIYDKPAGIASDSPLLKKLKPFIELIHRLDKETSGVLMFAKTLQMKEAMIKEFQHKRVKKTYVAIVYGRPVKRRGVVDDYLGKVAEYQGQSLWGKVHAEKGLHARTEWEIMIKGKEASVLCCLPITGRTHQIRVHLSSIGHPILGDHVYGHKVKFPYQASRCFLHALSINFTHPLTKLAINIKSEIPGDMQTLIQHLQKSD